MLKRSRWLYEQRAGVYCLSAVILAVWGCSGGDGGSSALDSGDEASLQSPADTGAPSRGNEATPGAPADKGAPPAGSFPSQLDFTLTDLNPSSPTYKQARSIAKAQKVVVLFLVAYG